VGRGLNRSALNQPRSRRGAARIEEGRQRQPLAEGLHRLVGDKARTVGDDFEQVPFGSGK